MAKQILRCTVNGEPVEVLVQPYVTLLDALREDMGLTGPKEGCGTGDCGACTIHVDGKVVASCLMLAMQARGRTIRTIEGLASADSTLHPLQDAFVRAFRSLRSCRDPDRFGAWFLRILVNRCRTRGATRRVRAGVFVRDEAAMERAAARPDGDPEWREEIERAKTMGVSDLNRVYGMEDLARSDVMFAATGVTFGDFLKGVRFFSGGAYTQSVVMRSRSRTTRLIDTTHYFEFKPKYE